MGIKAPTNVGIEVKDLTNFSTLVWKAADNKKHTDTKFY
jgi:hypothetical protein